MNVGHQILNFLNSVPADVWKTLGELLVAAFATSPLWLGLRKWLNIEIRKHAKGLTFIIGATTALLTTLTTYVLFNADYAPYLIAFTAPVTYFLSQPVYLLVVRPLARRASSWFAEQVAAAATYNSIQDSQKTAVVPAGGLPIGSQSDTIK